MNPRAALTAPSYPGRILHASGPLRVADMTEASLARAAAEGDEVAFAEIVRRHQDRIYSVVATHCRDSEEAVDLVQEVFIKAYRRLESFRAGASLYTWLYRIAINTCIDAGRRRALRISPVPLQDVGLAGTFEPEDARVGSSPELAMLNNEMGRMLHAWIQALPEHLRRTILLSDIAGLSQEETARILGCPIGTVKSRLQRARCVLREGAEAYLKA